MPVQFQQLDPDQCTWANSGASFIPDLAGAWQPYLSWVIFSGLPDLGHWQIKPVNQLKLVNGCLSFKFSGKAGFTFDVCVVLHSRDHLNTSDSGNHQGLSVRLQMENETHLNATTASYNTNIRFTGCIHHLCLNGEKPVGKPHQPLTSARFDIWLPLIFVSPYSMCLAFKWWSTELHSFAAQSGIRKRNSYFLIPKSDNC